MDVTIRDNHIVDNDKSPGLNFTGALTGCPNQPGNGIYETDETGDCGGALHLVGTVSSIVSDNLITGNADGVLISDETAESRDNLLIHNVIRNNPLECGIVLASHPPAGQTSPPSAPHHGVNHNTVAENISSDNGVKIGGSGAGMFSDGAGRGRVSDNVIIQNKLTNNGLGGVALHTHVGPAFGLPADDMHGNMIIGNFIAGNLADQFDTATPGRVGININSGGGGSPVRGTVISQNIIRDEDIDIAVNTPAEVDIHLNDLRGTNIGGATFVSWMARRSAPARSTRQKIIGDVLPALTTTHAPRPADPIFVSLLGSNIPSRAMTIKGRSHHVFERSPEYFSVERSFFV